MQTNSEDNKTTSTEEFSFKNKETIKELEEKFSEKSLGLVK